MIAAISAAAVAGLLGSPHCIGMCGPFSLACGGRLGHSVAWHVGKTSSYMALGAAAGAVGHGIPGPGWIASVVSAVLVAWFAASLAGIVSEPTVSIPGLAGLATRAAKRGDLGSRLVFGVATGFLPCGLVYATLGIAVASGSALTGALAMGAFGTATMPMLTAFGVGGRRLVHDRPWLRRILALAILVTGLWMVARRHGRSPGAAHDDAETGVVSTALDSGHAKSPVCLAQTAWAESCPGPTLAGSREYR